MWSVWSETVDVYLGQGVAMLKAGRKETLLMRNPATLPMERVLAKLAEMAAKDITKGSRLQVSLSGAWCPALSITIPEDVTRWQERQQIALASAANDMGTDLEQIACEIDALAPGTAAAIPLPMLQELERWAAQLGCRLVSVCPLWAVATQCKISRSSAAKSLLLLEPAAATLLADDGKGGLKATTLPGEMDTTSLQVHSRQWLLSHGHDESKLAKIGFDVKPHPLMTNGPKRWAGHWYSP